MARVNHLVLVRHGENRANLTKEFSCRRVDYSLTEKGRLQAQQTAEFLASVPFDEIWSSPLKRASETASAIAAFQRAPLRILEELREMDVGDLEGMASLDDAWSLYAALMREWLAGNPERRFPNGESRRELCHRFRSALERLTDDRDDATILVVGHGGLFTHGVVELCGIEDQRAFYSRENHNCSISAIDVIREGPEIRFVLVDWASVSHLSGEAALVVESVPEAARVKNL